MIGEGGLYSIPSPTAEEYEDLLRRGRAVCPYCVLVGRGWHAEFPADRASIRSSAGQFHCRHHLNRWLGEESADSPEDDLDQILFERALTGARDAEIGEVLGVRSETIRKDPVVRRGRRLRKGAQAIAILGRRADSVSAARIALDLDMPARSVQRVLEHGPGRQAQAGIRSLRRMPSDVVVEILRLAVPGLALDLDRPKWDAAA
jgi:hypothetical protein